MRAFRLRLRDAAVREPWSEPVGEAELLGRLEDRMRDLGRPYRLGLRNHGSKEVRWSPRTLPRREALSRVRRRMQQRPVGDILFVRSAEDRPDEAVYAVRIVTIEPSITPPPAANALIADVHRHVFSSFPGAESWGAYNCRRTRQGGRWSEHCRWARTPGVGPGANALDVHFDDKRACDRMVDDVRRAFGDRGVTIIWRDGGLHEDHAHIQGPLHPASATPECAGGSD